MELFAGYNDALVENWTVRAGFQKIFFSQARRENFSLVLTAQFQEMFETFGTGPASY